MLVELINAAPYCIEGLTKAYNLAVLLGDSNVSQTCQSRLTALMPHLSKII